MHTYTSHISTWIYAHMHTHILVDIHIYADIHPHVHEDIHIYAYTHADINIYAHLHSKHFYNSVDLQ